ncbi:MAG: FxsA family protein [Salaquimonas sp.]
MPFSIIPFLLLIIPITEIAVFILIGGQIGVLWTFGLILLTAIIGSILLRVQGFQIINRLREETNSGRIPGKELGHGAMILVAGVLLLTPGFVTDTIGFLLFIPLVRSAIWSVLASRVSIITPGNMGGHGNGPFSRGPFRDPASRPREDGVVDLDPEEFEDLDKNNRSDKSSSSESIKDSPWRGNIE